MHLVRSSLFVPGHKPEWVAHARGVLAAMAAAEAEGRAAVIYEGDMVNYAMVATARELIALAASLETGGASVPA